MKCLTIVLKLCLVLAVFANYSCTDTTDKDDDKEKLVPELVTAEVTDITAYTATSGGQIKEKYDVALVACGVCWDTVTAPTVERSKTIDNGTSAFTSSIQGLRSNTTYYLRAYALNQYGIGYGNERSFTTLKRTPLLKTDEITVCTDTSAAGGGSISEGEDYMIREFGICVDTLTLPTINKRKFQVQGDCRHFTVDLARLKPGTAYFARTYLLTGSEIFYGNEITFRTKQALIRPSVTTYPCTGITETGATGHIRITNPDKYVISESGICLSKTPSPTIYNTKFSASGSVSEPSITMSGLSGSTTYYIRGYIIVDNTILYGNELTFTTRNTTLPQVSTLPVSGIAETEAVGHIRITNPDKYVISESGICLSKTSSPTIYNTKFSAGGSVSEPSITMSGLSGNTTYYIRGYIMVNNTILYGNEMTFNTLRNTTLPRVATLPVSGITANGAVGKGRIDDNGGSSVTECGICWSRTSNPVYADSHLSAGKLDAGEFSAGMSELAASTRYYVRAYAKNSKGIGYGNVMEFTTLTEIPVTPAIQTLLPGSITTSSVKVNGFISNDGGEMVVCGICWGKEHNPDIMGNKSIEGVGNGSFSSLIEGLSHATTYYFRAYATDRKGVTYYGNEVSAKTKAMLPVVNASMDKYSGIDALCNASISENGGSPVISRGFCWSIVPNPTINDRHIACGAGNGMFAGTIGALSPETKYFVRAFATNEAGTAYSSEITLTTQKNPLYIMFGTGSAPSGKFLLTLHFDYKGPFTVKSAGLIYGINRDEVAMGKGTKTPVTVGQQAVILIGLNKDYYIMGYVILSDNTILYTRISRQNLPWYGK